MRNKILLSAAILVCSALASQAKADTYRLSFGGSGVTGSVDVTYGTATDAKYPGAFEITGITGIFSDSNIGITNATITGLVPINHATPESGIRWRRLISAALPLLRACPR